MPEATIVIKAEDRYSATIKTLSNVTKSFDKNTEHLERTLHELSGEKSVLKAETDKARKAMQEAQKQFAATGDAADALAAQRETDRLSFATLLGGAEARGITDGTRPQCYATRQGVALMVNAVAK